MKIKLTVLAIACSMATSVMAEKNPEVDPELGLKTTHQTSVNITGLSELELDPDWVAIDHDVYQRNGDTKTTVAFGNAAIRMAADRVQESIDNLNAQAENQSLTEREELKLLNLELELNDLQQGLEKTYQFTPLCSGNARFETAYGWFTFTQPYVMTRAQYDEFGPLSPGQKIANSYSLIHHPSVGLDDDDVVAQGGGFLIRADSLASIAPTFQCQASSFAYVRVLPFGNQCTDIVFYSNSATCNSPAFQ